MSLRKILVAVAVCSVMAAFPFSASSFALRGYEKGAKVPDYEFAGVSGEGGKLSSFLGEKGLLVIYWATWSSRSPAILAFAEKELREKYGKLGVNLLAVNADHQEMKAEDLAAVKAKVLELGLSFPVVLDAGLRSYNEIGVISTPTSILLDRGLGIVDAYPGFPSIARDDIPDRLDAMLGIEKPKRNGKDQYYLDHKPKNYALQYYNLGKTMFQLERSPSDGLKRVPDTAIERLDEAIRRDPDFFRPYLLKAIIYDMAHEDTKRDEVLQELKKRDFQEVYEQRILALGYLYLGMDALADDYFRVLSSQAPDDPGVLFGTAVVSARRKDAKATQAALAELSKAPEAAAKLKFEYAPLFTGAGEIAPGKEGEVRLALERLLEIEKR